MHLTRKSTQKKVKKAKGKRQIKEKHINNSIYQLDVDFFRCPKPGSLGTSRLERIYSTTPLIRSVAPGEGFPLQQIVFQP